MSVFVSAFHILFVGTLFLYVGLARTDLPKWAFPGLLGLGGFIVVYHLYKLYLHISMGKSYWVNLFHILLVGPLLMWIGYNAEKTPRMYFEFLLMLAFAVIGYHGYYSLSSIVVPKPTRD